MMVFNLYLSDNLPYFLSRWLRLSIFLGLEAKVN